MSGDLPSDANISSQAATPRSHEKISVDGSEEYHCHLPLPGPQLNEPPPSETPQARPPGAGAQGSEGLMGPSDAFVQALQPESCDLECAGSQELSVDTCRSNSTNFERCKMLRQELGEGEGVTALLERSCKIAGEHGPGRVVATEDEVVDEPLSSPRLRQTTFTATLNFVDALCDASSSLVHIPQVGAQVMQCCCMCPAKIDFKNVIGYN